MSATNKACIASTSKEVQIPQITASNNTLQEIHIPQN
jgi:hypothetical protein